MCVQALVSVCARVQRKVRANRSQTVLLRVQWRVIQKGHTARHAKQLEKNKDGVEWLLGKSKWINVNKLRNLVRNLEFVDVRDASMVIDS